MTNRLARIQKWSKLIRNLKNGMETRVKKSLLRLMDLQKKLKMENRKLKRVKESKKRVRS